MHGACDPAPGERHFYANVGVDNFFFVDSYYCDEHAKEFDDNPPPGEKDWREWKVNPVRGGAAPRDPYLGTKRVKPEDPHVVSGKPKQESARRPSSRNTGPKTPDHPTCTNTTMTGEVCRKPIAHKFIGRKDRMFHLCPQCAEDLQIS